MIATLNKRERERGGGEVKQAGCILWINIKETHVISAIRNLRKDRLLYIHIEAELQSITFFCRNFNFSKLRVQRNKGSIYPRSDNVATL